MMIAFLAPAVAIVVALLLAKYLSSPASWLAHLDHPNDRSLHREPIPRTGGLAVWAGVGAGLLVVTALGAAGQAPAVTDVVWSRAALTVVAAIGALIAVSFWDDRTGLPVAVRIAAQAFAASAVVFWGGLSLSAVAVPLTEPFVLGPFAGLVTVMGLVWFANLYNFMDGMDGFAGGMTAVGYAFLAVALWATGHATLALITLVVAAAAAGFLLFNFPPAKIFLGDVGSVPLGFLTGVLAVRGVVSGAFDVWVPLLIFSPFAVDATVTLLRRAFNGERVWSAHRTHNYQRLVLSGWGHRRTVLSEYLLMLACGFSALVLVFAAPLIRALLIGAWVVIYSVLIYIVTEWSQPSSRERRLILRYRRPVVVLIHLAFVALANYLAFWLRFEGEIPGSYVSLMWRTLPWLLVARGVAFLPFRLYQGLWRYVGIWDLINIVAAVAISSAGFALITRGMLGYFDYPRSVYVIDALLLVFFFGGIRLARRLYHELGHPAREQRVLIYGAGDAGEMLVRDIINNAFYDFEPIGFVDDDHGKVGRSIHGVPVLGTRADLVRIIAEEQPHEVIVAITKADPAALRAITETLAPFKVPIKILPNLRDVLSAKAGMTLVRSLSVEDLLARPPIDLDPVRVPHLVGGKRILVTGAGGSIGSELCRQIAAFAPAALIMVDRYENGLHDVQNELIGRGGPTAVHACIADVTDAARVAEILARYRPDVVFHAAAHKHVPLMEANPCEAIKNNVGGTRTLIEETVRHGVGRFILISTDKAVNPSSVMGATKRIAELLVQVAAARPGAGSYAVVRFGNVLGSNGSVVPRFVQQIKNGGPVTVTHPEMKRYFMLISEAVQLVLHAAALATGGETFVLEMGEQIKMVDMARNLIRLSGYVPDVEIPIVFVGMRPGEKLLEELTSEDEVIEQSPIDKVMRVRSARVTDAALLFEQIERLERMAREGRSAEVVEQLRTLIPTFEPEAGLPSAAAS